MSMLVGLLLALNIGLCASLLSERWMRGLFGVLALAALTYLVQSHFSTPGYEVVPLLVLGLSLSGMLAGPSVVAIAPALAALIPMALVYDGASALSVHNHWQTVAVLTAGLAAGFSLRQAWTNLHARSERWGRALFLLPMLAAPLTFIAMTTPRSGARAGNVLLPMVSLDGLEARLVVLQDSGASSWPWLEPLENSALVAIAAIGFSALLYMVVRSGLTKHRVLMSTFALATMIVWGVVTVTSSAAVMPLMNVDPELVVEALRPSYVPAEAMVYLAPERAEWRMSQPALALWLGMGAWLASSALLTVRQRVHVVEAGRESSALAPLLFVVAALFFAEAWSLQSLGVPSQKGANGALFALAALVGAATLLQGRLRTIVWMLVTASTSMWLVAFVSERVIS